MKPSPIVGSLLLALLCGCASSAPRAPQPAHASLPDPLPDPLIDADLRLMIEDRGGALSNQGALPTRDAKRQLERASCHAALPPIHTATLDVPSLYAQSVPATLVIARLFLCDKCPHWHTRAAATAFAITADGLCVTNYHVFDHDDDAILVVSDAHGTTRQVIEILAASQRDDIAIFRVSIDQGPLTPLPLRPHAPVGADVAVISHPANHYYSLSTGVVSRRSGRLRGMNNDMPNPAADTTPDPTADPAHPAPRDTHTARIITPTLEITADYGVGSSGGPVLDLQGNVVGMVSNTKPVYADPKERRSLQMNIHHCVPAESILRLIEPIQPSPAPR